MAVGTEKPARSREGWGLFISGLPGEADSEKRVSAQARDGTVLFQIRICSEGYAEQWFFRLLASVLGDP